MAKAAIVPIQQQAVETRVDTLTRPPEQRFEQSGDWQRPIYTAGVVVIHAVSLLPARSLHQPPVHADLVELFRMQRPKRFELGLIQHQRCGNGSDKQPVAGADFSGGETRQVHIHKVRANGM